MSNIVIGNHALMSKVLDRAWDTISSVFCHGTFGIGKTKGIEDWCRRKAKALGLEFSQDPEDINDEKKFVLVKLMMHQLDVAELKGLPFPSEDRTSTRFLPLGLLPVKGQGMLFLDEINLAAPMVQSNSYQLIHDRQLGFYKVPDGFITIGAGNMIDDRGNTFDMPMPLKNRFVHMQLKVPTYEEWVKDFAVKNGIDHRVIAFLAWQRDYLYKYDPSMAEDIYSIPTPRTWEMASKLISGLTDPETIKEFVGMAVGAGIGNEFASWMVLSQEYDLDGIYSGKKKLKVPSTDKADYLYSLISALVGYYNEKVRGKDKHLKEYANTLFKLSFEFEREHTVMILSLVNKLDKGYLDRLDAEAFDEACDDVLKMLY